METMDLIKQLRDETGVSVMDCKRALDKAGNDLEKARIILKEEGLTKADKKAALAVPGVVDVIEFGDSMAVLAKNSFAAEKGRLMLAAEVKNSKNGDLSTD